MAGKSPAAPSAAAVSSPVRALARELYVALGPMASGRTVLARARQAHEMAVAFESYMDEVESGTDPASITDAMLKPDAVQASAPVVPPSDAP